MRLHFRFNSYRTILRAITRELYSRWSHNCWRSGEEARLWRIVRVWLFLLLPYFTLFCTCFTFLFFKLFRPFGEFDSFTSPVTFNCYGWSSSSQIRFTRYFSRLFREQIRKKSRKFERREIVVCSKITWIGVKALKIVIFTQFRTKNDRLSTKYESNQKAKLRLFRISNTRRSIGAICCQVY